MNSITNYNWGKRLFDILVSAILLPLMLPFIIIITLSIYLLMGAPILFLQNRPGFQSKIFTFYKFRTMTNTLDKNGNLMPDKKRLTSLGKFLRKTSLDELPSLLNVLKGDMSLVGPRPLLEEYLPFYTDYQLRRHDVRPGITGWAQINGRNSISWEEKFNLDIWYIENQSFKLDIKILLLTTFKILKREGISHKKHATMPKFNHKKDE